MIVVDASATLDLLLNTAQAPRIASMVFEPSRSLHAPHLLDLEVVQVLRRWVRAGNLSSRRARQALDDLADLHVSRYPHQPLLDRIWDLRANASAYDAAYIALAEALDATLVTCDAALGRVPGHAARVEVISRGR